MRRNGDERRALNTMAMMLSSLAALAADCAPANGNCFESECCADEGFSCYRRVGVMYAQCKPTVENCLDNADWLCPSWTDCTAEQLGECTKTRCCKEHGWACHKSKRADYAQCRKLPEHGPCVDSGNWLCPASWMPCSKPNEACTTTKCCNQGPTPSSPHQTCYAFTDKYSQCMDTDTCSTKFPDKLCTPVERDAECASYENGENCASSACCELPTQRCYMKSAYYGACLEGCDPYGEHHGWTCAIRDPFEPAASRLFVHSAPPDGPAACVSWWHPEGVDRSHLPPEGCLPPPHHAADDAAGDGDGTDGGEGGALSPVESALVAITVITFVCGGGGLLVMWVCFLRPRATDPQMMIEMPDAAPRATLDVKADDLSAATDELE